MVGIVIVSHSEVLADGVVRVAREMASPELLIEPAGGIGEPDVLGTDADRVRQAIERAMSPDGVLVMMDLGSALMSAEFAVELLEGPSGPVRLSAAPLVEGAVAAAVAASSGASLADVAAEARGALAMKTSQVDDEPATPPDGDTAAAAQPGSAGDSPAAPSTPPEADATAEFPVLNEIGLHARPAARFVETIRGFDASVTVTKLGGPPPVSAASLTNLVALAAHSGDTLLVGASGPDAQAAVDALAELAATGFGDGVSAGSAGGTRTPGSSAHAAAAADAAALADSASVGAAGSNSTNGAGFEPAPAPAPGSVLKGVAVSAGIVVGPVHRFGGAPTRPSERETDSPQAEQTLLDQALVSARQAIEHDREVMTQRAGKSEAEIFDAHLALLDDDALRAPAGAAIAGGASAEQAWFDAAEQVAEVYRGLPDPLLQERASDVLDVGQRVVTELISSHGNGSDAGSEDAPTHGAIVLADELTPSDTVRLDPDRVIAIATAQGSTTTHAAILARSLGLPAVLGLGDGVLAISDGTTLLLDGTAGTVTVSPTDDTVGDAQTRREQELERAAEARSHAHEPAHTRDGTRIQVYANIGSVADATRALESGAEGVGMLRTEFLFMGRPDLPDEEEQTEALRAIARELDGRPLIVRTLDAGADKPLPALPMPAESNPYLGMRGIRLGLLRSELLATQFRALLRAAAETPVKVMMPMVANLAEVLAARELFEQARRDTGATADVEFGVTVEVPGAALASERLAPHVDFFCLGTNDLAQYTMAAERGDARLASLLEIPQPAVLRLIKATVEGGAKHGCWTGVCGEMGGDPAAAILLAGLGVTELSMAGALVPDVKHALRQVDLADAQRAAAAAIETDDAQTARAQALRLLA